MKKMKTIIVFLMLVLISLPATSVIGTTPSKEENKKINIEYNIINEDGSQIIKEITVNENDIASFNKITNQIFEKIASKNNYDINEIIKELKVDFSQNPILSIISTILGLRPLQKRVLILSDGYGAKFDLQFKRDISLHKRFNLWYYPGITGTLTNSKTIIIDPIPNINLKFFKYIEGQQFGIMTKFIGFYILIPGGIMDQTQNHIFFFGYAKKVWAFDLPDITDLT